MKRIFTFLLAAMAGTMAFAQDAPTGVFKKASVAPVVDGVIDAVWAESNTYNIERAVVGNTPTIGAPGETTWKGLWTKDGVYILLDVKDNAFFPNYVNGSGNDYDYDKLELYFDVNYVLVDDAGPGAPGAANSDLKKGHYQVAPGYEKDKTDGRLLTGTDGVTHAFMVDGSHTIAEYFVPFTKLLDADGVQVDKTSTIGFDITVIDRDPGDASRNQAVWSNTNASGAGESWANLDNAGRVTFEGADQNVLAETISISNTNLTITADKGTLQLVANVGPEDATIKTVRWTLVGGTAQATLSSTGLISASGNGTIIVKASTTDGSYLDSEEVTITITGQKKIQYTDATWNEKNLVKNWDLTEKTSDWGGWVDGAVTGQLEPVYQDGYVAMKVGKSGDAWHYQFNQTNVGAEANVEYTVKFKSWATATAECVLDFESASSITTGDGGDQYVRYGTDTDNNGTSEWRYTVTNIPSWFTYHVKFDKMIETTVQKMQWMNSLSEETIYLDSVLLVKTEDIELVTKNATKLSNAITSVYPSPVTNTLFVDLKATNAKVAVYNAIGQKLMEKTATGNKVTFDVRSLRSGMYFVKLEDGTTKKFIK